MSQTICGIVRNFQFYNKTDGLSLERGTYGPYNRQRGEVISNTYQVWSFMVETIDSDGNTISYTSVYLKAGDIEGNLSDGDEVEIEGEYSSSQNFKPKVIRNKTSNSSMKIEFKTEYQKRKEQEGCASCLTLVIIVVFIIFIFNMCSG